MQHTKYQGNVNYISVSASIDDLFLRATLTSVNAESCLAVLYRPTFCVDLCVLKEAALFVGVWAWLFS